MHVLFVVPVRGPKFYIFLFSPEQMKRDRFCGREPRCRTGSAAILGASIDRGSILVGVDESWGKRLVLSENSRSSELDLHGANRRIGPSCCVG
jgi:hypothetical protein